MSIERLVVKRVREREAAIKVLRALLIAAGHIPHRWDCLRDGPDRREPRILRDAAGRELMRCWTEVDAEARTVKHVVEVPAELAATLHAMPR